MATRRRPWTTPRSLSGPSKPVGRRAGLAGRLRFDRGSTGSPRVDRGVRAVWVVVVLALLLVAVVLTLASGALRNDSRGPFARNGAIAFTVQGNDHGPAGTHLMNADGTGDRPIDAGRCPTYSRDGRVLASLAYEESAYLVVAGADGRQVGRVLLVETPTATVSYALSPDGLRVAWFKPVEDGAELWVAPVAGGPGTRILRAIERFGRAPGLPVVVARRRSARLRELRRRSRHGRASTNGDLRGRRRRIGPAPGHRLDRGCSARGCRGRPTGGSSPTPACRTPHQAQDRPRTTRRSHTRPATCS